MMLDARLLVGAAVATLTAVQKRSFWSGDDSARRARSVRASACVGVHCAPRARAPVPLVLRRGSLCPVGRTLRT